MVPKSLAEFEAAIRSGIHARSVPSVAYGVSRRDEVLLVGAAGLANKERRIPATSKTPYRLASVTKPLTATALMMLAERNRLELDLPANRYLGESKIQSRAGNADDATIRRVADHTAGLPLHYQFFYEDEPFTRPPMEETIRRYGKTFSIPGERHWYSNLGYGILDSIIERVTGTSFGEFLADELFDPLGMAHASVGPLSAEAVAYGPDGVGYPHYDFDHPGGSAAYASVEDLLTFGQLHLGFGPDLISRETRNAMQRASASIAEGRGYGFGWGIEENLYGHRVVQHTGGMGGVNTILRLVPELDLVIAILVNGQSDLPFKAANDALASLSPTFRSAMIEDRRAPKPRGEPTPIPPEHCARWIGVVETHCGRRELRLDLRSHDQPTATIRDQSCGIEGIRWERGRILGVFDGDVGTEDAARRPYRIHLDLKPSGHLLRGAAVTITRVEAGGGGAIGNRLGNALSYWIELAKE